MDKLIVPYTNGLDQEVKGYVDLTKVVEDAVTEAEKEIQAKRKNRTMKTEKDKKKGEDAKNNGLGRQYTDMC